MTEKIYAMLLRLSRNKKEMDSLQNHREILEDYAEGNNLQYEPIEYIVSGMKEEITDRPDIQEIINNIDKYKGVIVYDVARVARDIGVGDAFKKICKYHELELRTPYYIFDFSDPMAESMYEQQIQMATNEGRVIAKRNKDNKIVRARRGEWISSDSAFGYKRGEDRKLVIVPEQAEIIRKIFQLHNEGLGSRKITDTLNAEGIPSPKGKHWNLPSIKRIIRNEVYKGTILFNDNKTIIENGKRKKKLVEQIRCEKAHPPIIEPVDWFKANRDRMSRAEKFKNYRERPATKTGTCSLKDLVYCGLCKRKHTVILDNKCATGYVVKVCDNRIEANKRCNNSGIRLEHLEKEVFERIDERIKKLKSYVISLRVEENSAHKENIEKRLNQIEKQLKELEEQDNNLLQAVLMGFSKDKVEKTKKNITESQNKLKLERELLVKEMEQFNTQQEIERIDEILERAKNYRNLPSEEQNEILKTFIKRINYTREIPEDIKKLSTRNPLRKNYKFKVRVEFYI